MQSRRPARSVWWERQTERQRQTERVRKLSAVRGWWIYIYVYIYCHPQTDCFVQSELFSVARHIRRSKPGSKNSPYLLNVCEYIYIYIYIYSINNVNFSLRNWQHKPLFTFTRFWRKSTVMNLFMSLYTVSITEFTDYCVQNFFFTR